MARPGVSLLSPDDVRSIHETSLYVLREIGVVVPNQDILRKLQEAGATVDLSKKIARFPEGIVLGAVESANKQYVLYGREPGAEARFGHGEHNLISSPGQSAWFDYETNARREPRLVDARSAITVGDALPNVTVVGAMTVPVDAAPAIRDVVLTSELIRGTGKPTRCWPVTRRSTEYVLEIYRAVAGGKDALRARPMVEVFLEPISPLQLPETGLDVMIPFLEHGQPVSIGPMVMASGTGPATLAGTIAQENAEILAGICITQLVRPGMPVCYGGICHAFDMRTTQLIFAGPEQAIFGVAMTQMGKHYGLPVYVNSGLTDSKRPDA
ncbi:MAG: trimethylamine methyltransferase family protein, partial [Chloroflexi bacterium]|nr:trimethylamine methyltransferase family protein [Chloroflexota bacterium]